MHSVGICHSRTKKFIDTMLFLNPYKPVVLLFKQSCLIIPFRTIIHSVASNWDRSFFSVTCTLKFSTKAFLCHTEQVTMLLSALNPNQFHFLDNRTNSTLKVLANQKSRYEPNTKVCLQRRKEISVNKIKFSYCLDRRVREGRKSLLVLSRLGKNLLSSSKEHLTL